MYFLLFVINQIQTNFSFCLAVPTVIFVRTSRENGIIPRRYIIDPRRRCRVERTGNEIAHENAFYSVHRECLLAFYAFIPPSLPPLSSTNLIDRVPLFLLLLLFLLHAPPSIQRFFKGSWLTDDIHALSQMEDEGNHGNDDTRCFILSTLAALQWSRVSCVLCRAPMLVFDRYPLVDGTFFLSPRQHSSACAEVIWENFHSLRFDSFAFEIYDLLKTTRERRNEEGVNLCSIVVPG